MNANVNSKWYEDGNFNTSDLGFFYSRLMIAVSRMNYHVENLGFVSDCPIPYISYPCDKRPRVLIAAGFHGEEQAGPWAVLRYLEIVPANFLHSVNVGFLPMVNPTGFRNCRRFNDDGDSPNTGFIHPGKDDFLSVEGELLTENKGRLVEQASDGFLTLHEQTHTLSFYMYAFERGNEPSARALSIRDAGGEFFPVIDDGLIPSPGSGVVKNGVVLNEHDGTFEDMLFHNGVSCCYTTETPVKDGFAERVQANMAVIRAFIGSAG